MRIYISGKVSGDSGYKEKFAKAAEQLEGAGFKAVNPVDYCNEIDTWPCAMRKALRAMLDSDGVALLPDWQQSAGAKIEVRLAWKLSMPVLPLEKWIKWKKARDGGNNGEW